MIAHYDMTTGEWINVEEAEHAPPGDSRQLPSSPAAHLTEVREDIGGSPEKRGLPADIAALPVSFVLAKWP